MKRISISAGHVVEHGVSFYVLDCAEAFPAPVRKLSPLLLAAPIIAYYCACTHECQLGSAEEQWLESVAR